MKTFVMTDIHGAYDHMMVALARIYEMAPEGGTIVFTGDYVDRGPKSSKVIELLMGKPLRGWRWHILKGNHEDMLVAMLRGPMFASTDEIAENNEWGPTLRSYNNYVPDDHLDWMRELPIIYADKHRVYVHAYANPAYELDAQSPQECLWDRYRPDNLDMGWRDKHVVHGHTPHEKPQLLKNRTNLDSGCFFTGTLTVGVFDDDIPGGPIQVIPITADLVG